VLFTGLPIQSHLVPVVVTLAKSLRQAGREVAIATGAAIATEIERHGVHVLVLPDVLAPSRSVPSTSPMPGSRWTSNVELAPFVPQRQLLGESDFFLTHAGFS
jgi:UDP:flavonoid glycosyltransferase YjiC (YdhE family)